MGGEESKPIVNFLIGLFVGVGMTFLYIRFGIEMPAAVGIGQRITSEAIVKAAEFELYNSSNPPLVRHRALAVILTHKPEKFLAVDQAIDNRFLNEFLLQHQSEFGRSGPVVLNPADDIFYKKNGSQPGTTVLNSGVLGVQPIGMKAKPNSLTKALLQQSYPDASNEVIDFLAVHPEIRTNRIQIGLKATLPAAGINPANEPNRIR